MFILLHVSGYSAIIRPELEADVTVIHESIVWEMWDLRRLKSYWPPRAVTWILLQFYYYKSTRVSPGRILKHLFA
jgi:hypothetical protein